MKTLVDNIRKNYTSNAKVVDGTLILSIPDAITPAVWRLELGNVRASAMEVRTQNDGAHALVLTSPKGGDQTIAPFDSRDKAIAALMAISHAMEQAHGQIKPGSFGGGDSGMKNSVGAVGGLPALYRGRPSSSASSTGKLLVGILGLGLIFFMLNILIGLGPKTSTSLSSLGQASGNTRGAERPRDTTTGVPVSADDFLMNR